MTKARLVYAEVEGDAASVIEALRSFAGTVGAAAPPQISLVGLAAPVAEAPALLPAAVAEERVAPARPAGRKAKTTPRAASAPAAPAEDSGCVAAVLQALAKGPLTSPEVIRKSGFSDGGVYVALKKLRTEGRVEMVDDDGVRKNKLVE